jgi:hypothetical protein
VLSIVVSLVVVLGASLAVIGIGRPDDDQPATTGHRFRARPRPVTTVVPAAHPEITELGRARGWRRLRSTLALLTTLALVGAAFAVAVATALVLLNLALRRAVGDLPVGPGS